MTDAYTQTQRSKKDDAKAEEISLRDRWGVRTNVVDWLLTIPNIDVEFDLGSTVRNKCTINANIEWNQSTSQTYTPSLIFNVFDVRMEWKQYFRTHRHGSVTKDTGLYTRLRETVFVTQRKNSRQKRACYREVYANASSHNLKVDKRGRQGSAYGTSISVGYIVPLYGYRNNYISLELGDSAGLLYTSYNVYTHDTESNCYPRVADKCKDGYIVPFPLIINLQVTFVHRFMSVGSKYEASIYRQVQIHSEKRDAINAKTNAMHLCIDSIAGAVREQGFSHPDSLLTKGELKQRRLTQQERKGQILKEAADKLYKHIVGLPDTQLSDALTSEQKRAADKALKECEKQLKREAETQDSIKLDKHTAKDTKQVVKKRKGRRKKKESGRSKKEDGQQELRATKEDTEVRQEEAEAPDKEEREDKA